MTAVIAAAIVAAWLLGVLFGMVIRDRRPRAHGVVYERFLELELDWGDPRHVTHAEVRRVEAENRRLP